MNTFKSRVNAGKNTIFIFAALIIFAGAFAGPVSNGGSSIPTAGTIYACWNSACAPSGGTVSVTLKNVNSDVPVASCDLAPERTCCRMDGDFVTGTYFFEYKQAGSSNMCTSSSFSYTNGQTVSEYLICPCP
jgi:hypothetical protein